ncbi:hypothetical protein FSARC_4278 [Fusarium sarcochroum]|uniref:Amino acid transporter n=1 Tax=Fusarium sarcochroum TaxID=1208366 RepID=A0A8H4U297_9HYPO|nr:hypothetical protein FSARC_4278 [Fusarium sarcochroum]
MSSTRTEDLPDDLRNVGPWRKQEALVEPRHEVASHGALDTFDVFALIVNKMIGTGIYTTPAAVYLMTGSKTVTMGLFVVGFAYTIFSMVLYLDYAKMLPFKGGELVYVDEIASHVRPSSQASKLRKWKWRFFGDGLLVYIIYSIAFIFFFNSGTNALQLGQMILACITGKGGAPRAGTHHDLMRFIGIFFLSLICLLQYFSPRFGRSLNKTLAVAKVIMLLGILITAGLAVTERSSDADQAGKSSEKIIHAGNGIVCTNFTDTIGQASCMEWDKTYEVDPDDPVKGVSLAKALLAVLFSFQGWENATLVTGEIPGHKHHVLRNGFIIAVITVGCLYLAITAAFLSFVDGTDLVLEQELSGQTVVNATTNVDYVPMFNKNSVESKRAWSAMAGMSSFGSLNAIIYTFSRVKQAIGQADVLPWSRFWKQDDIVQREDDYPRNGNENVRGLFNKSPQGGLIIHWILSVVLIMATIGIDSTPEAASLPGYIQTYVHCAVLAFLGMGFFNLESRKEALWSDEKAIYVLVNLAILVDTVIPPYKATGGTSDHAVPGWAFLFILGLLVLIGTAYYILFFGAASRVYQHAAVDADHLPLLTEEELMRQQEAVRQEGIVPPQSWLNWMRWAGVQCEIRKNDTYDKKLERVYRFGRRWKVVCYPPGDVGYQESKAKQGRKQLDHSQTGGLSKFSLFLYWLFGGTRLNSRYSPVKACGEWWDDTKRKLRNLVHRE